MTSPELRFRERPLRAGECLDPVGRGRRAADGGAGHGELRTRVQISGHPERLLTSTHGWFVVFISLGDNAPGAVGRRRRLGLPASPSMSGRALDRRTAGP